MKGDRLDEATRALRDRYVPEERAADALRRRRFERALDASSTGGHRWTMRVALLIAASFVGATAWAGASGRITRWLAATHDPALEVATRHGVTPGPSPAPTALEKGESPADSSAPVASPPQVDEAPVAPATPRALPRVAGRPSHPAPPVVDAPPAAPDLDALYREAHDAHFVRKDPHAALAAWDRYLAAAGANGRMTVEARYNRAMALIRLGRNDEAREALAPFARGEYGGYRRDEAVKLLGALP